MLTLGYLPGCLAAILQMQTVLCFLELCACNQFKACVQGTCVCAVQNHPLSFCCRKTSSGWFICWSVGLLHALVTRPSIIP
jgi:hypothetical protein